MKPIIKILIIPLCLSALWSCVDVSLEDTSPEEQQIETRAVQEGEIDYERLSDLFAEDIHIRDSIKKMTPTVYSASVSPFGHTKVLSLGKKPNSTSNIKKILILAEQTLYADLQDEIQRYAFDIHTVYGCEIIMETVTGGNHTNVKNLILSYKLDLDGVVFFGDFPAAKFEIENDHNSSKMDIWACDLYYTDLDGSWSDSNGNGIYDAHKGNIVPEIFLGRISTKNMQSLFTEVEGMKRYLDKNHDFWTGTTKVNRKAGLSYTDHDWIAFSEFKTGIQKLYGATNTYAKAYGDAGFGRAQYMGYLSNKSYEFIQLACHSTPIHMSMSGGGIAAREIYDNGSEAIGVNLFCCSGCDWTWGYMPYGYLGAAHVYNPKKKSLVAVGSTKTGSMLKFQYFYTPLGQGKTIGEALKLWWPSISTDSEHYRISWFYGMTIIGDPMINLFYQHTATSQVTLNGFDTGNAASHRYVRASSTITANNYAIPAGKKVIFDAPNAILNSGFVCSPESTLLIGK